MGHRLFGIAALLVAAAAPAAAAVVHETAQYEVDGVALTGFVYYDGGREGRRPGVLVVHEWWGLNDYARQRAEMLARLGYVAFAVDMYGDGKVTEHPQQAGEWAGFLGANPGLGRARFERALALLQGHARVDPDRIAAIGYCFGGGVVLSMARAGLPLQAVVSFHGSLPTDPVPDGVQVRAKILVCHGAADGFIPAEAIARFQASLDAAGADWQFVSYGGARHGFTNPRADSFGMEGLRYDDAADHRSWSAMQSFLEEAFAD